MRSPALYFFLVFAVIFAWLFYFHGSSNPADQPTSYKRISGDISTSFSEPILNLFEWLTQDSGKAFLARGHTVSLEAIGERDVLHYHEHFLTIEDSSNYRIEIDFKGHPVDSIEDTFCRDRREQAWHMTRRLILSIDTVYPDPAQGGMQHVKALIARIPEVMSDPCRNHGRPR